MLTHPLIPKARYLITVTNYPDRNEPHNEEENMSGTHEMWIHRQGMKDKEVRVEIHGTSVQSFPL